MEGIRLFCNDTFNRLLPQRAELGNTEFRRAVMEQTVIAFGISVPSAATHYNHALKQARLNTPALVKDLGRASDKKGGRKPLSTVTVVKVRSQEVVASGISRGAALTLIATALAKGKAKLEIQETPPAADPTVLLLGDIGKEAVPVSV